MYDLSQPNDKPGQCIKCRGTGVYNWGAQINGKSQHSGQCFSCRGSGRQTAPQIRRNRTYNRYKVAEIIHSQVHYPDPGELAEDRWNKQYS